MKYDVAVNPEWEACEGKWKRMRDVIGGEDTIKACGETYLPKLEEQTPTEYQSYKTRAKFFNATGRTMSGLHGMLFRKNTEVKFKLEEFLADCDLCGRTVDEYVRDLAREMLTVGRGGTLIDYSNDDRRSYLAFYCAESIVNWEYRRIGQKMVLAMVALMEPLQEDEPEDEFDPNEDESEEEEKQLRVIELKENGNRMETWVTIYVKEMVEEKTVKWTLASTVQLLRKGQPLDFVPFVFHGGQHCCKPPLEDIALVNIHHYRLNADYNHALFFTANPTAWVAGFPRESKLKIGSSTAWVSEETNAKAGFLEYTGQGLDPIRQALEDDKAEMAVLGARLLEEQKRDSEAAETVRARQTGETSVLGAISGELSSTMTKVLQIAGWWEGSVDLEKPDPESASVTVNRDFVESRMAPAELAALVNTWMKGGISQDTLLDNLRRGEIVDAEITNDEERDRIEAGAPMIADFMAAMRPEKTPVE